MITVDSREGSNEMLGPIKMLGVEAEMGTLEYGDMAFIGRGPDGCPYFIGIERKKIKDLLNSMATGRLSGHQLPGLLSSYNVVYLIVEGEWKVGNFVAAPQGSKWAAIKLGGRVFTDREVNAYLNTLMMQAEVKVWWTRSRGETARVAVSLYHWWNDKAWDGHKSHLQGHKKSGVSLIKQSLVRRVAAELPGIGWGKSRAVEKKFKTLRAMIMAEESDWCQIEGIGKTIASRVVKEVGIRRR